MQTRMTFLASRRLIAPLILALIASVCSVRAHLADQPWTRHVIDASSRGADGVRTADVNGDGIPDLVAGWEQGGLTRVHLGSRAHTEGPRWRAVTVGQSPDVEDAAFFDADGDGSLDIVSSTEGTSRKLLVHWAPSRERYANEHEWKTEVLYADGTQWMFAVPMDVDRGRGLDLVAGGKNERAAVGWLESPAQPRNVRDWRFHRLSDAGWIMSLMVRDMNRDGRPDVLLSDRRGRLSGVRWLEMFARFGVPSTGSSTRERAVSRSAVSSGAPTPCSQTCPARASSSHPPSPAWPSLSPASFRRNSSSRTRCLTLRRSAW